MRCRVILPLTFVFLLFLAPFAEAKAIWLPPMLAPSASFNIAPAASYRNPSTGVVINSYSPSWNDSTKLQALYNELMANTHRGELGYLSRIDIRDGYPLGDSVIGAWFGQFQWKDGQWKLAPGRWIELYGGRYYTTVASVSRTLSHEYGHHFTNYNLYNKGRMGFEDYLNTGFARSRNLKGYSQINNGTHEWAPEEIAAEDYVQLFGSPLSKTSTIFQDVRDRAVNPIAKPIYYSSNMYNLMPQENNTLPLAAEVTGLHEYWLNLSGIGTVGMNKAPSRPVLALTQVVKKDYQNYVKFAWTKSYDDNTSNMEYTLVYYTGSSVLPTPVRTTYDSKGREAIFGQYYYNGMTWYDRTPSAPVDFVVLAKDSKGKVFKSNRVRVDFKNPSASLGKLPLLERLLVSKPSYRPASGSVYFTYNLLKSATVEACVKNAQGTKVATLQLLVTKSAGTYKMSWDGRSAQGQALLDGRYQVVITAQTNDQKQTLTGWLAIDTKAPVISVSSPKNNATVARSTVTVQGTSEAGATVIVNSRSAVAGANGAFALSVTLRTGANTITVTARDKAGNTRTTRLTVTYKP